MFRVIVCGSRDFDDEDHLNAVLNDLLTRHDDLVVVQGGAPGADRMAKHWADNAHVPGETYPADWSPKPGRPTKPRADGTEYDPSAGPTRNHKMLSSHWDNEQQRIQGVIAFYTNPAHPSRGTAHMVRIAKEASVRVYIPRSSCWGEGNCVPGNLCPTCWREHSA